MARGVSKARLAAEIDAFEVIGAELAAIATRTDPDRRRELTVLRRRLSARIGSLRDAGIRAFADPATADEFRARLSVVLNTVALHQANWPAISIDEGQAAYRESAAAAAAGNRAFIDWTRAALTRG